MTGHDGGPAYPAWSTEAPFFIQGGQSLRDCFARTVNVTYDDDMIDGIGPKTWERAFGKQPDPIEHPLLYLEYWARVDAKWRYMKADAMLAERERKAS